MRNQTVDDLKAARKLIDAPDKWTKGVHARDEQGNDVVYFDARATCFCIDGAIQRVTKGNEHRLLPAYRFLNSALPGPDFVIFNDDAATTHADVLTLMDTAIAEAERVHP